MNTESGTGIRRRSCVKAGLLGVTGGALLSGCESDDGATPAHPGAAWQVPAQREDQFEQGMSPLEGSGWVPEVARYPALAQSIEADVCVIGAGLAGSSLGLHLARAGLAVAVLEARQPGWGASGRNAGHVLPTLRSRSVFQRFPDGGRAFLEAFREHHTIPFDLAREYAIDCDAIRSGYLHATQREGTFEELKQRSRFWRQLQGQAVDWLGAVEMREMTGSDYYAHGVLYRDGGRVNPYLFTNGLIRAAIGHGARVFGDSAALRLQAEGRRWRVSTQAGSVIAGRVVLCTNAYPGPIEPRVRDNFYPLTAYGITTEPLPEALAEQIMPGGATLAQEPVDLHPFLIDRHRRIVVSSLPTTTRPADGDWHFAQHLRWIHRTWPATREANIRLQHYWTGRVALRDEEFPGVFELHPGVYGLMHFNAWGNVMAPLMGKLLAEGLASERLDTLPFPLSRPQAVGNPRKQHLIIRRLLIPAARLAQRMGML
ncbi:FAD-dependent oxidoreductase [Seongchinamella sediminis]|uniref:FAD-dependent oxidoreductase n=1 Tax=Seongchinamella sediminis TaxID=2283635 RepID=A0A3L7DRR4_9GAMM|nr:FAD-dependent oxidoreductase [Seongchinamella sediminis]RLQ20178.1 FAD-dependent oxidoreductase [Seongchinamella sediminis]